MNRALRSPFIAGIETTVRKSNNNPPSSPDPHLAAREGTLLTPPYPPQRVVNEEDGGAASRCLRSLSQLQIGQVQPWVHRFPQLSLHRSKAGTKSGSRTPQKQYRAPRTRRP